MLGVLNTKRTGSWNPISYDFVHDTTAGRPGNSGRGLDTLATVGVRVPGSAKPRGLVCYFTWAHESRVDCRRGEGTALPFPLMHQHVPKGVDWRAANRFNENAPHTHTQYIHTQPCCFAKNPSWSGVRQRFVRKREAGVTARTCQATEVQQKRRSAGDLQAFIEKSTSSVTLSHTCVQVWLRPPTSKQETRETHRQKQR